MSFNLYTPLVQQGPPERVLRNHILHGAVHDTQGYGGVRLYVITLPVDRLFWGALGNAHDTLYSLLLSTFCDTLFQILFQFRKANREMVEEYNYDAHVGKCHEDCCVACGPHHGRYRCKRKSSLLLVALKKREPRNRRTRLRRNQLSRPFTHNDWKGCSSICRNNSTVRKNPVTKVLTGAVVNDTIMKGIHLKISLSPSQNLNFGL